MALEKRVVHKPDADGNPNAFVTYAARTEYLEGVCKGINTFRGERESDDD